MGILGWIEDRILGGNHNGPQVGGMPPMGVPLAKNTQGYNPSPFGQQGAQSFQPGSSNMALQNLGSMYASHSAPSVGGQPQGGEDTPWYKNPDVLSAGLNTVGGLAQGYMQQRTQNRQMDTEDQRYKDEQERKKQMADYLAPIYARIMGQQPAAPTPAPHYGAP